MTTTAGPAAPSAEQPSREAHLVSPVAVVLALTALLALVLTAFSLPAIKSAPHDVPLGMAARRRPPPA